MLSSMDYKKKRRIGLCIFLIAVFLFIFCWAFIQPLNASPDEQMRYLIVEYIVKHGTLPDGRDLEITNALWGISYGYYPILAYMIMAVPAKIVSLFTTDTFAVLMAARLVNAVFGTVMAYLVFRISEMLFRDKSKYMFTALVVFLPGVIFVHSYVNNDSMALLSTAWIVYVWVISIKTGWTKRLCVSYAGAVSLCVLSYYNAYGFVLCAIIFFFTTILIGQNVENRAKYVASRTAMVVILVLVFAGWWYVRNYIIYDGDFLAWNVVSEYAEIYAADGYKPSQKVTLSELGYNPISLLTYSQWAEGDWIHKVCAGFVGTFGQLDIYMPAWMSYSYYFFYLFGVIGALLCLVRLFRLRIKVNGEKEWNKEAFFNWCMLFTIIITAALLVYYNLYNDIQPQGRYLLPAVIPAMYFVTVGIRRLLEIFIKKEKVRDIIYLVITACLIMGALLTYIKVFYPAYM